MRNLIKTYTLFCFLLFVNSLYAEGETILVKGFVNEYPFCFQNKEGKLDGFVPSMTKLLMKELEVDYVIDEAFMRGLNPSNNDVSKHNDLFMMTVHPTHNESDFYYSIPYMHIHHYVVHKKGVDYRCIYDLNEKNVLTIKDNPARNSVRMLTKEYFQDSLEFKYKTTDDLKTALGMVDSGEIDFFILTYQNVKCLYKLIDNMELEVSPSGISPLYISIASKDKDLIHRVNNAITRLYAKGEISSLLDKWLFSGSLKDYSRPFYLALLIISFFVVLLIVVLIAYAKNNRGSKRKLAEIDRILSVSLPSINAFAWKVYSHNRSVSYSFSDKYSKEVLSEFNTVEKRLRYIHPDDKDSYLQKLEDCLSGKSKYFNTVYRSRLFYGDEGSYLWWEARGEVDYITENGETYICIQGVSVNINKIKLAELSLRDLNRQNEIILKNSSSHLIYTARNFEIVWSNVDDSLLEKYSTRNLKGSCEIKKTIIDLFSKDLLEQCFQTKSTVYRRYELDDLKIILDAWASYTVDDDGKEHAVIRIDNVTEREHMIKDLKNARIKAEESDRLKMAFLANMSHEIRTPLNSIVGFSELLYDATEEDEKEQYISIIQKSNEVLLNLVGNILELSKIESGVVDYSPTDFNFTEYFLGAGKAWQKGLVNKDVELRVEMPDLELHINHDQKIINQILTNYISNALKYTKNGWVKMSFSCTSEELKIFVQDTGIGISDTNKDQIFGRFAKLDDFAQGTGLGLSICRALAETCNGDVGFTSQEGQGSTFWVRLPLDPYKTKLISKMELEKQDESTTKTEQQKQD